MLEVIGGRPLAKVEGCEAKHREMVVEPSRTQPGGRMFDLGFLKAFGQSSEQLLAGSGRYVPAKYSVLREIRRVPPGVEERMCIENTEATLLVAAHHLVFFQPRNDPADVPGIQARFAGALAH